MCTRNEAVAVGVRAFRAFVGTSHSKLRLAGVAMVLLSGRLSDVPKLCWYCRVFDTLLLHVVHVGQTSGLRGVLYIQK